MRRLHIVRISVNKKRNTLSFSCGLVHPSYPFMGASPDGKVSCEFGVVEIKCPYSCKDKSFLEATAESTFFLKRNDGVTNLKTNHTYFHRVQAQMKFCIVTYCNFVVWREEELFVQRIYPNEKFLATALEKVTSFIKLGVLPELLGKWYSKAPVSSGMGCRDLHQTEDISSQPFNSSCHEKVW